MLQFSNFIENLNLKNEFCLSIGDTAYGSIFCQREVSKNKNHVHIYRLRSNRAVYKLATESDQKNKGRIRKYGQKFVLNNSDYNLLPDNTSSFKFTSKSGKNLIVEASCWENMIFKGTQDFKTSDHPFSLTKFIVKDEAGNVIFKRPLWTAVLGKRRDEIKINDVFFHYMDRYDIEHLIKFGKNGLLMDKYQSPDTSHEESWWNLVCLACLQLFFVRKDVDIVPKKWERYLAEFKNKATKLLSPSYTQRGFSKILEIIGTPAKLPIVRGLSLGRKIGDIQTKRKKCDIIFKTKKLQKQLTISLNKSTQKSNPKKSKDSLIEQILKLIKIAGMPPKDICAAILADA